MKAKNYTFKIRETLEIHDDRLDKMVSLALEKFPEGSKELTTTEAKKLILDVIREAGFDKDAVADVKVEQQSEKEPGTGYFALDSKVLEISLSDDSPKEMKVQIIGTMAHELYHADQMAKDPNYVRKEKDANRDTVLDDLEIDPYSYTIAINFLPYLEKDQMKMLLRDILYTGVASKRDETLLPMASTLLHRYQLADHDRLVSFVRFLLRRNDRKEAFKEFVDKVMSHYDKFKPLLSKK
jgi:hypothetical protein